MSGLKFVMATHNSKKLIELRRILLPLGIEVVCEADLPMDFPEVEETGSTFRENALLKARSACLTSGLPAIADDSGLMVDALDGAPGVYSARYAGEPSNDKANNEKLLKELYHVPQEKRTAKFVSAIACVFPENSRYIPKEFTVRGECCGTIGFEQRGDSGFGYDPLFMTREGSFAEISAEKKDKVSHRGIALRQLADKLQSLL